MPDADESTQHDQLEEDIILEMIDDLISQKYENTDDGYSLLKRHAERKLARTGTVRANASGGVSRVANNPSGGKPMSSVATNPSAGSQEAPVRTRPITVDVNVRLQALAVPEPDGRYSIIVPALPGCFSQADSIENIQTNAAEAAEGWLEVAHDQAKDESLRVALGQ